MFFSRSPTIDLIVAALWLMSVAAAWWNYPKRKEKDEVAERALGAAIIGGQLNGVITGSSIIMAGIVAFVALGSAKLIPPGSFHIFWAAVWAVTALGFALYTLSILPSRAPTENVVRSSGVATLSAMALFFSMAAGVRFVLAVSAFL